LWRTPAVVAEWRRSERNSFEDTHAGLTCADRACKHTGIDFHLFRNFCGGARDGRDKRSGGEETFHSLHVFSLFITARPSRRAVFGFGNFYHPEVGWIIRNLCSDPIIVVQQEMVVDSRADLPVLLR
jgi:hypothetical protein